MSIVQPTNHQIEQFTRLAADLPDDDICKQLYVIQSQGPQTAGAWVLRRAIAEIIAMRVMVRKIHSGQTS